MTRNIIVGQIMNSEFYKGNRSPYSMDALKENGWLHLYDDYRKNLEVRKDEEVKLKQKQINTLWFVFEKFGFKTINHTNFETFLERFLV